MNRQVINAASTSLFARCRVQEHRKEAPLGFDFEDIAHVNGVDASALASSWCDDLDVGIFDDCRVNIVGMRWGGVIDALVEVADANGIAGISDQPGHVLKKLVLRIIPPGQVKQVEYAVIVVRIVGKHIEA